METILQLNLDLNRISGYNKKRLTRNELIGKDYEFKECLFELQKYGLDQYVTFHNPIEDDKWKENRERTVDLIIKIGKFTFYVECKKQNGEYYFEYKWLNENVLERFDDVPLIDKYTFHILLTNRPDNFSGRVENYLNIYGTEVLTIDLLITKLLRYLDVNTDTSLLYNTLYTDNSTILSNYTKVNTNIQYDFNNKEVNNYLIEYCNSGFNDLLFDSLFNYG